MNPTKILLLTSADGVPDDSQNAVDAGADLVDRCCIAMEADVTLKVPRESARNRSLISLAVASCFAAGIASANPIGPQVVNGAATLQNPNASTLAVTNTPGAIINWQGFSIGAGEVTRFIQQSSASSVLNRVVSGNVSQIYGQLLSNGRVFLINPGGIVVGPGAIVDTAGFVASTLNMMDADFIAGKLRFQGDASSGSITNQGWIRTGYGGTVVLVAPHIENSGLIHTPGGELILAAGQKLTVSSLDHEGVQFEVQAPTDSVVNLGRLLADGGAVGAFAGTLRHSGDIRANSLVYDQAGQIVLRAAHEIQLTAGSTTAADGRIGGRVTLQAPGGLDRIAGTVSAQGSSGKGGDIRILGDRVAVIDNAVVNASGTSGGGQILVGGDFRGGNAAVQNSGSTFVGADASLRADATQSGDGGRVIVWSDDKAQFYGSLSAQGGPLGGSGGFAEVSGKQNLVFAGSANLGAALGKLGTLLLDPLDLFVDAQGGLNPAIVNESTDFPRNAATVSPATLASVVGNVTLLASRYLRISSPITLTTAGQSLAATVETYTAPASPDPLSLSTSTIFNELEIGANITTNGGAVSLTAPTIQGVAASTLATAGGAINLSSTGSIQASLVALNAGSGAITATSGGSLQLGAVTGGSFSATAPSFISIGGPVTTSGGAVSLTSSGSSVSTSSGISASGGAVALSGSSVSGGIIDTTGAVTLNGTFGVNATVNNSSSLTATSGSSVSINSTTDLNVANVTAGTSSSAQLSTSTGSIRGTGTTPLVKGFDVSLLTTAGTGGGIGTAASALNVDVQRNFTFRPNGDFNILLTGSGPNQLNAQFTPANTGTYSGTLAKQGGGLTLNASADTTTVTLSSVNVTSGFDQPVSFSNPSIQIQTTNNANLVASAVTVPTGDTQPTVSGVHNEAPLPVTFSSSGNLTVNSYTRTAGGLAKSSTFSATGSATLGTVDASKDTVSVTGPAGITVGSLVSTGNMTLSSTSGTAGITVGSLNSGGNVTVSASSGPVNAQSDNTGVEITAGGVLTISGKGIGIGTGAMTNPLDLTAATINLTSTGIAAGPIGGTNAVVANTPNLTVNASSGSTFNVSTGATSLANLTVTANPTAVGDTGLAQISTPGGPYVFDADALGNFTFNPPVSTGRNITFTSTSGDIALGATDLGTGNFVLSANGGGIFTGGASIAAAGVTLNAVTDIDTSPGRAAGAITASTGNITLHGRNLVTTGALNAPGTLTIDGNFNCYYCYPDITIGAVGGSSAPATISIFGGTVTGTGSVNGAGNVTLYAGSGLLTLGGGVTGSGTVSLTSSDSTNPLAFTTINAGATGTVLITSSRGIRQTADGGSDGVTAKTVSLIASSGDITNTADTDFLLLDLHGTTNLTVDSGGVARLDAHNSQLTDLTITKRVIPATAQFELANMGSAGTGGVQTLSIAAGTSPFELSLNSPTALNFTLTQTTANDITLMGGGIVTTGGNVNLTSTRGLVASGAGITSGGGDVTLQANNGSVNTGAGITSGGGDVRITTFGSANDITSGAISSGGGSIRLSAVRAIDVSGNLTAGAGTVNLDAGTSITRTGGAQISSDTSVEVLARFGDIGTSATPMLITSPTVMLDAVGTSGTPGVGHVFATLTNTTALEVIGENGFNVSSNTAFTSLAVETNGTGSGTPGAGTLNLTAPGQTYVFDRPATDLFGTNVSGSAFEVVSVTAPTAAARFTALDGILLVRGASAGPNKLNVQNLTLTDTGGGDVSLQGTSANPLVLSSANQTFSASGGTGADVLIRGNVALSATTSQAFTAAGNITVNADAGGGGAIAISAPTQTFTTNGGSSKIELLGGAAAGEKVTVTSTTQQQVTTSSSSVDSFKLQGGSGQDASVTFSHSGSGLQNFQMYSGTVTVAGGSGQNSFAKIEETGANQQKICYQSFSYCYEVGSLKILGGAGAGAYAQVTASGSQYVGVTGSTVVKGGTGDGAHALLQSGTGSQTIFGYGSLTIEGQGAGGATAKAEILASGSQSIYAGNVTVKAGSIAGSLARIATTGSQYIYGSSLTLTAGGAGQTAEPFVAVPGASATIEGQSQNIDIFGAIVLNGGAGTSGNTADAILRNLSGTQDIFSSGSMTLNGGHTQSTTGILNLGTGSQTITANGGLVVRSDPNLSPAHADSSVLIQNQAATLQTINASGGGVTLLNSGDGTVAVTSAGTQTVSTRFVDVTTAAGSTGDATLFATGDQRIHTTNESTSGYSILVAARGAGTAKIESGASQLLEVGYPEIMTGSTSIGVLKVGYADTAGASRVKAVDQRIFAGSIIVESGSGNGSIAELGAVNSQVISTLKGGITVQGGAGANTVAKIGLPLSQTILANGDVNVIGGLGSNAIAQIVSGSGSQTLYSSFGDIALENEGAGVVEVTSGGTQTIDASLVDLFADIGSAGSTRFAATGTQSISAPSGLVLYNGGSGAVEVTSGGAQTVNASFVNLSADVGSTGSAKLAASGDQSISAPSGGLALYNAGSGAVEVTSGGAQTVDASSVDLFGSSGSTKVSATGTQSISALSGGLTLFTGGSGTVEVSTSGAQTVNASSVDLFGSTGSAKLTATGNQSISALSGGLTLYIGGSGTAQVTSGGTQTVNASFVNLSADIGSVGSATLAATGIQSISALSGGLTLSNSGSGTVEVSSASTQTVDASYVDVVTISGSTGISKLIATGDQSIHTTSEAASPDPTRLVPSALPDYGLRVAAFGTGTALIESGATQRLDVTNPELVGNAGLTGGLIVGGTANGTPVAGTSSIKAVDQTIFAGTIWVETGLNSSSPTRKFSEIKASNRQEITTLNGGIVILGGAGDNTVAQIDPLNQTITADGDITIVGGSGTNAIAQLVSGTGTQTVSATGDIVLIGGSGMGADALIVSGGLQAISALGSTTLVNGVNPLTGGLGGVARIAGSGGVQSFASSTYGTSPVTTLDDYLIELVDTVLTVEETTILTRRAPICR